jgi:hypothetical protein
VPEMSHSVQTVSPSTTAPGSRARRSGHAGEQLGPVAADLLVAAKAPLGMGRATMMRNWGTLTTEVASVVTPIRLLMRSAAATDPEMAALLEASDDERLERMAHHARFLQQRGYLRQGVTLAEATDVLWTCSSVELYELLVLKRGWSLPRFAGFIADFMIATLLSQS